MAFGTGLGLPRWVLGFLKKRREKGVSEGAARRRRRHRARHQGRSAAVRIDQGGGSRCTEPLKSEFNAIIETQTIGMPLGEACARLYRADAAAGGELLRHRGRDPAEVGRQPVGSPRQPLQGAARPQEDGERRSGDVDGSQGLRGHHRLAAADRDAAGLDSTPDYIALLWTHPIGQFMLVCCVGWMTIGILVMKKMINFDF
jgi:tight adherence protein B